MIPIKRNHFENHVISGENSPKYQGNHQKAISNWERYKTYEKRQSRKYQLSEKKPHKRMKLDTSVKRCNAQIKAKV